MPDHHSSPATTATPHPDEPATAHLRFREAYQKISSDLAALDPAEVFGVNIDVMNACTTVMGALARIMTLREQAIQLPNFDLEKFDNLETYALALLHAQGEYVSASAPPAGLLALNEEGIALRDNLHSDAVALANRGVINAEPLQELRGAPGYKKLAEDLVGLSSLLRRSWEKIGARSMTTMAELDRAEDLSERLLHAVAVRDPQSTVLTDATQKRMQVFTLFIKAYDETRRAITFLRWHEKDLEEFAPSLYAGRARKKREPKQAAPQTTTTAPPPATAPEAEASAQQAPASESSSGVPQDNPFAHLAGTPGATN